MRRMQSPATGASYRAGGEKFKANWHALRRLCRALATTCNAGFLEDGCRPQPLIYGRRRIYARVTVSAMRTGSNRAATFAKE